LAIKVIEAVLKRYLKSGECAVEKKVRSGFESKKVQILGLINFYILKYYVHNPNLVDSINLK